MINGTIVNILTQKENDWGRYKVETPDGKEILAVGVIKEASIGMNVTLEGEIENSQYGKRFKITEVLTSQADDFAGIRRFLTDGYIKGLGLSKANAIVATFGKESLDMFETEEGLKKLQSIKGIGEKNIVKIKQSYDENKVYVPIVLFLNGTGTKAQIEKIHEKYGNKASEILKENPYRLQLDIDGFGFKKTDAIAIAGGIKLDSTSRVMAGIKYVIDDAAVSKGHCYLTLNEIRELLLSLLVPIKENYDNKTISKKVVEHALEKWSEKREQFITAHDPSAETLKEIDNINETRNLINEKITDVIIEAINENILYNDEGNIYTVSMYNTETRVAELLHKMVKSNPVRFISAEKIEASIAAVEKRKTEKIASEGKYGTFEITKEQRDAVYLALMHRISIISGGPGRGKTAISEIVAHGFMSCGRVFDKDDIIMLAPTGRAAQRITESTGYDSMTVHRAVMANRTGNGLPSDKLILIDESSMVDIRLMRDILEYGKDCNIVFVGDVDQIASVGPGKVLKDMIDSGVIPCILLKEGHRNIGTIAQNSALINAGVKLDKYVYDEHFVYIPSQSTEALFSKMIADYTEKVKQYGIKNVMLCCAMKERGTICVNKLNKALQDIYTKDNQFANFGENRIFRVGDRVMQTKNDYSFEMLRNGKSTLGIFNGERGTVSKIIYDPEEESYKMVVLFDDGSVGGYTKATAVNLTLAYATTLHKCQGSEAACMMMSYTFGDYMLLNRSLFYTGETRAKKEFRFYGEETYKYGKILSAFDVAVGKTDDVMRNTGLAKRLKESI